MKEFILFLILGLGFYSQSYAASEQVFKINNTLATMDIDAKVNVYIAVLDSLTNDIKNDGIEFKYDGVKVSGGVLYVVGVKVYLKREIFEKYRKYANINRTTTIWNEVLKKYNWDIFLYGNNGYKCKLAFRLDLLDGSGKVIDKDIFGIPYMQQDIFGKRGAGGMYSEFFNHIRYMGTHNKSFGDELLYQGDMKYNLPLSEIQKIDAIKFSVIDLYKEGMD